MVSSWSLTRRLRVALGGFSLLLVLAVLAVLAVLGQADHSLSAQTQRILPARVAASQLLTALVDQETGLRGYAITRDARFLQPYRDGLATEARTRAQLERFVGPQDPARLALLTVDAAITAWREEYADLRLKDVLAGSTTTTIEFGRQLFAQVRTANAALDVQLSREARSAQREASQDRRLVLVVLGIMSVVVAAALVGLQRALRKTVLQPLRALAQQVESVSQGRHGLAIKPGGPPDIVEMGEGVELMRLELVRTVAEVEAQQRDITRRAAELARSNADLEQFAYVASHDLQEPLRKVASFCQLLEQRYGDQLDERGVQYIAFAVDGAKRMQRLITDLLTFSRVGRTSEGFVAVDVGASIARAWAALDARVLEAGAQLELEGADVRVHGDASLLQLLFGNLLGNALKYRRDDQVPRVRVTMALEADQVRIDVADNGIGIPQEYAEKVFVIFQRLHGRDEYEGTGIGLALCKKVVEFHDGTIELRPSPLGGACVSFTLPLESESR